jgi:hypothetical protein
MKSSLKRGRQDADVPSSPSSDGQVDSDPEDDEEEHKQRSPPKRVRRASILPGFPAYNEAIMASLDALLVDDMRSFANPNAEPDSDSDQEGESPNKKSANFSTSSSSSSDLA